MSGTWMTTGVEVLTSRGYVPSHELDKRHEVACIDPWAVGPNVEFSALREVRRAESPTATCRELYLSSNGRSLLVSPDSPLPLFSGPMAVRAIEGSLHMKDIIWGGVGTNSRVEGWSNEAIGLVAWIVCDGNIKTTWNESRRTGEKRASTCIRWSFRKERKVQRVAGLLDCLGHKYGLSRRAKQVEINLSTKDVPRYLELLTRDKLYPIEWLSTLARHQAHAFLVEALQADGDWATLVLGTGGARFNSSRTEDVDFVSALISINYGMSTVSERVTKGYGGKGESHMAYASAVAHAALKESDSGLHDRLVAIRSTDVQGPLTELTSKTGFVLARQSGVTYVAGTLGGPR